MLDPYARDLCWLDMFVVLWRHSNGDNWWPTVIPVICEMFAGSGSCDWTNYHMLFVVLMQEAPKTSGRQSVSDCVGDAGSKLTSGGRPAVLLLAVCLTSELNLN